jgi:hypothetical protein
MTRTVLPPHQRGEELEGAYMTINGLARASGFTPHQIQRMLRRGELRAVRLGAMWVINREDARRLIAAAQPPTDAT